MSFLDTTPSNISVSSGKVLQVVSTPFNTPKSHSSATFASMGHSVVITPASTSSKILLTVNGGHAWNNNIINKVRYFTIYRGSTDLGHGSAGLWTHYCNALNAQPHSGAFLDAPSTTDELTYTVYARGTDTSVGHYCVSTAGAGTSNVPTITLTAIEVSS